MINIRVNPLFIYVFGSCLALTLLFNRCEKINPNNSERYVTTVDLRGRILDSCDGEPFANQKVVWYEDKGPAGIEDPVIGETMTDDEGYFEILDRPFEYVANTKKEGIDGISDSYVTICLPGDLVDTKIADGFLGITEFSEGNHNSNGNLGDLFVHGAEVKYRLYIPKKSQEGNHLDLLEYDNSAGWIKEVIIDSSNAQWWILDCTYEHGYKHFIWDDDQTRPLLHNGYTIVANGWAELADSTAGNLLKYRHTLFRFPNCGYNGTFYMEYNGTEPL